MSTPLLENVIDDLIGLGRRAADNGMVFACFGSLSARLPDSNQVAVTGRSAVLGDLKHSDFSVVDLVGNVVSGCGNPSPDWLLHRRSYLARSDVNCVVHVYPRYVGLLQAVRKPIHPLDVAEASCVSSIGEVSLRSSVSNDLADALVAEERHHDCVLLSGNGSMCLGDSVGDVFSRCMGLERAAEDNYRASLLGEVVPELRVEGISQDLSSVSSGT